MNIYDQILFFLHKNDNGQYIDISSLNPDFNFLLSKAKELEQENKIKIRPTFITNVRVPLNDRKVEAKILLLGIEHVEKKLPIIEISKEKKIHSLNKLIYELRAWRSFERSKVDNFIDKAKNVIKYIDGKDSNYLIEIDIFNSIIRKKRNL